MLEGRHEYPAVPAVPAAPAAAAVANPPGLYRQGSQGQYDGASKSTLENEFGTSTDEDVIKQIIEKGSAETSEVGRRLAPSRHRGLGRLIGTEATPRTHLANLFSFYCSSPAARATRTTPRWAPSSTASPAPDKLWCWTIELELRYGRRGKGGGRFPQLQQTMHEWICQLSGPPWPEGTHILTHHPPDMGMHDTRPGRPPVAIARGTS